MRCPVVASIILAACSGQGPQRIGAAPSWRSAMAPRQAATAIVAVPAVTASRPEPLVPRSITFTPASAPAALYNDAPPPVPRTPLADAVIAATLDAAVRAGAPAPTPDGRLFEACAELAELALDVDPGYQPIAFAMQHHGIIEANARVLFLHPGSASPDAIVQAFEPQLADLFRDGAPGRLGVALARRGDAQVIALGLVTAGLSTLPIPRTARVGDRVVIDAVIDGPYHDPRVFVTSETGAVRQVGVEPGRPGGFVVRIACDGRPGRQQIEIGASGATGAVELANFPVWCGAQPPRSMVIDEPSGAAPLASPEQAEHQLLASVNRARAAAGLPALIWDDAVAAVARGYSNEMRRTQIVGHVSPTSGSFSDRLRSARIRAAQAYENVGRAQSADAVHQGLMDSPGHRATILSSAVTHVGIGVAFGDVDTGQRETFVTELFTRPAPAFDHDQAIATVRTKLLSVLPSSTAAARLDQLAQQLADRLVTGESTDVAYQALRGEIDALNATYERPGKAITVVADLDRTDVRALLGGMTAAEFGLGIAQGPHPQVGDYAVWVVIVLANRRSH